MPARRSRFSYAGQWILAPLLWGMLTPVLAGSDLAGSPPVTLFVPTLDVFPQNFAIAQDRDAIVYVGNSEGVLTFDGERWGLIPLPNKDLVRSLVADGHGRLYVGGYDYFGYLERDATGAAVYHDLTPLYADLLQGEAFADIWGITITTQGIFFQAVQHLFQYRPTSGEIRLWRHAGRFGAVIEHNGEVLAQFRGVGVKKYQAGEWQPAAGGDALEEQIYELLPLPDGGLLTLARDGRWRVWRNGAVSTYAMPAGFPPSSAFSASKVMADGTLALGTSDGMLYFLDTDRQVQSFQLGSSPIGGIMRGNAGGLLVISDTALFRVAWPTRWTLLGADRGLKGSIHKAVHWGNRWFVLSGAGVYEAIAERDNDATVFSHLTWADSEAWDLLPLDIDNALLADSYDLKLIERGAARALTHGRLYPRLLLRSRFNPDVVYIGTELGFAVLQRKNGTWRLSIERDNLGNPTVTSLVETAPGEFWLGSERGGVWRVRLAQDYAQVADLHHMSAEDGIDYGSAEQASVTRLQDGTFFVSTRAGFSRWSGARFVPDDLHGLNQMQPTDELLILAQALNGDRWAYSETRVFRQAQGSTWQREEIGSFLNGALQKVTFAGHGVAVFASTGEILRYAPVPLPPAGSQPTTMLRSVEYVDLTGAARHLLPLTRDTTHTFVQGDFGIAFRFSLPDYRRDNATHYQGRLVPYEQQFSDWTTGSGYMYSRLSPGSYRFELRGRDSTGNITEITPFRFTILPYWYASTWAYAVWGILLLSILVMSTHYLVRWRTGRLALEKMRLESMVKERTRALESANHLLNSLAHLDSLTEIPNRRRLDDYLVQTWKQCIEQQRLLAILLIDVDHFKDFNDQYGHLAGDNLLKRLATILSNCLRRGEDLVARYGGEEFLVALPGADAATAQTLAEDMRCTVEVSSLGATISIGVATRQPRSDDPLSDLVHAADAALYEAKAAGRNCVKLA